MRKYHSDKKCGEKFLQASKENGLSIKCIEENIDTKLMDLGFREDFTNLTSKTREVKGK